MEGTELGRRDTRCKVPKLVYLHSTCKRPRPCATSRTLSPLFYQRKSKAFPVSVCSLRWPLLLFRFCGAFLEGPHRRAQLECRGRLIELGGGL